MRILKLIAIGIIENRAGVELSSVRVSLGEKLTKRLNQGDLVGADIIVEILREKENEIKGWKNEWVSRIEKL